MGGPESAMVCEAAHWNSNQNSSFELFAHAHARHEREAHALLHKALNGFDRRELEGDVKRCVLTCECLNHFHTRAGFHIVRNKRLIPKVFHLY